MNIVLHIIRALGPSGINRDDTGSLKSVIVGGIERIRVSSQTRKRAIREYLNRALSAMVSHAQRTRLVGEHLIEKLQEIGVSLADASRLSEEFTSNVLSKPKKDTGKKAAKGKAKTKKEEDEPKKKDDTLVFYSESEINAIAAEIKKANSGKIDLEETLGGKIPADGLAILMHGRMMANAPKCNVDAALMVGHAFSTNAQNHEFDYFTAIDDRADTQGAAHIGTNEFGSPCLYENIVIDVDALYKFPFTNDSDRSLSLQKIIEAIAMSNPSGRRNTFFADTVPSYIMAVISDGQPVSLAKSFFKPINKDVIDRSVEALKKGFQDLEKSYGTTLGIKKCFEFTDGDKDFDGWVKEIVKYVS